MIDLRTGFRVRAALEQYLWYLCDFERGSFNIEKILIQNFPYLWLRVSWLENRARCRRQFYERFWSDLFAGRERRVVGHDLLSGMCASTAAVCSFANAIPRRVWFIAHSMNVDFFGPLGGRISSIHINFFLLLMCKASTYRLNFLFPLRSSLKMSPVCVPVTFFKWTVRPVPF